GALGRPLCRPVADAVAASGAAERTAFRRDRHMIFVTVGVQLPFDRLVRAVDEWAGERRRTDVFAQIGPSDYQPRHIEFSPFVDPPEFRRLVEAADVLVAHAGMGSIITALELGKPLLVMPRRADYGEHRNDHQLATARHMLAQNVINVAQDQA